MLTGEQVWLAMNLLYGRAVKTTSEAQALSELLGSREEFVAWLFLKQGYGRDSEDIKHSLEEAAATVAAGRTQSRLAVTESSGQLALRHLVEKNIKAIVDSQSKALGDTRETIVQIASLAPEGSTGRSGERTIARRNQ